MYIIKGRFWIKSLFLLIIILSLSIWHMLISSSVNLVQVVNEFHNTFPYAFTLIPDGSSYNYPIKELPKSDYTSLMNITSFKFELLNKCTSAPILLVLVHTAPNNYDRRKVIRETWGSNQEKVVVLFMLGSCNDKKVQDKLVDENKKHKDIIQGSFLDVYRNITYKHVMTLKYAIYHCPQAKYILKTDDDVFVNMPIMLKFLTLDLPPDGTKRLLLCSEQPKAPVERSYRSKWRVSFHEYGKRYYPPYCPGWVIMYSPDALFSLYREAQKSKYFWIDDVLITGFVREKVNLTITNSIGLILPDDTMHDIISRKIKNTSIPLFVFGPVNLSVKDMYDLSDSLKNETSFKSLLSLIR